MSSPVLVLTHPLFLQHQPGRGHPESPLRLSRTLEYLEQHRLPALEFRAPRLARPDEIARVHDPELLEEFENLAGATVAIDVDTFASPSTHDAALAAAGAAIEAVEAVMRGTHRTAFALVRPPGHHAEPNRMMGFCFINNAAVAAEAARRLGAARVLILDWDVHHGNGTQEIFRDDESVLFVSLHQWPFYPGSGGPTEQAETTVNVPMSAGSGDEEYLRAFDHVVAPAMERFEPELLLVSAGFDAHVDDPLAGMRVTADGFRELARRARGYAPAVAAILEGGYNLATLPDLVDAALEGFTN
jgi:acetoin utilization deacetylase AcuC-like enzyme